uniref:Kinetochore scaffold 1 n=1 Tax=Chelonoidis abingdonii TaxID=106734 RepID=A0A8C0G306_CHEAB
TEKRRKNSRRVSFADTIKYWHDTDNNQMNRNDRTLIFLDENEMDMTASHTAVITRNLKSNEEIDKPRKIDIKSFLAGLTSKNEGPEMNKEFRFFCDPTEANYKIDFSEFLTSLKSSEMFASPTLEGPDKENLFFVSSQLPESNAFPPVECVYSHAQENTGNVTRLFRGQDDGMDITKCHVSDINTMFSNTSEALSEQLECGDVTVACGDMDLTASQTVKMSLSKNNTFNVEKYSQTIRMDLSSSFVSDHSRLKRTSNNQMIVPQDPQRHVEKKTVSVEDEEGITQSHTILIDSHKASQTSNQGCRTRTVVPGCVSFEPVFHGDKTIFFSSCNDMEVTGNCTVVNCNETSKATGKSCYEAFQKPGNAISLLMEKTVSRDDNMDITKCLTSDNQVPREYKMNAHTISSVPDNGSEKGIQNRRAASETLGLDSNTNPGSWTSKSRFQHSTVTPLLVSGPSDKTIVFSGEDMDLTRSYVEKGIASQLPPVSGGMSTSVKFKPQSFANKSSSSNLNEQEEMEITKCHAVVIDNQNTGITISQQQMQPKTVPGENWNKEVNEAVSLLNLDKENPLSGMSDHIDIKRSHPNLKTIIFSSQEQEREVLKSNTIATNNCVLKPLQRQNCEIPQQLRKSLVNPSLAYTNDKTVVFPDDQSMDITRNHTAALDFAPILVAQEYESTRIQNSVISKPKQLQNKTLLFSGDSDIDITRSQTAAIECGSLRMNSNQKNDTPGNNQIPALAAPRFSFTSDTLFPKKKDLSSCPTIIKTVIFSVDDDMEMTKSHTMATDSKIYLEGKRSSNVIPLIPADKTVVFTYNDDMEITRPNTVVIDKPMEEAASQSVPELGKGTGRKSLIESTSEKTVVFSLGDENDMELTKSHTMATDDKIYLQGKSSGNVIPLISADKTVVFTYSDDMEITRPNTVVIDKPMEEAASQTVPELGKGTGRKSLIGLTSEKTVVFSLSDENDMEITKSHTAPINREIAPQGESAPQTQSVVPGDKMVFVFNQDDMEITESHTIDKIMERVVHVDRLKPDKWVGQEASSNSKTVVFAMGDDMETTKIHTVSLDDKIAVQGGQTTRIGPVLPINETIVFTCNQDKMDITASHTVAINNNNLKGSENQEVSSKTHHQQNLCRTSAPICGEKMHFTHAEDLGNGCHSDFRDKHGSDFSTLSVLVFPYKKKDADTLNIHNVAMEKSIGPLTLSLPEVTLDIVQEPQNVVNLPKGNPSSVYCQDLRKQVKPKSKRVSFKLPENQIESPTYKTENLKDDPGKLTSSGHENRPTELDLDGPDSVILYYKETKENEGVSAEWEELTTNSQKDSEQTKPFSQVNDIPAEQIDPSLVSKLSGIVNICSRLKNCRRKSEVVPVSQTVTVSNLAETFPKLATQPEDPLSLGKDVEKESNKAFYFKELENIYFETGDALLDRIPTDKCQMRKLPLGIFPPKLPNKRNSSVPSVEDLNAKSVGRVEAQVPQINLVTSKTSDISPIGRQNLSPSQYIDEELLPTCPEEMDSVEFVSYEPLDGTCNEMNKKEIFHNKNYPLEEQETFSNQKRAWEQEEEELQKGKKIKRAESWDDDTTKEHIILSHTQAETQESENPPSLSAKSLERTNSSNSSCLDSLKADIDLSSKTLLRSSQMESQLLMDSICEQNLFEKFQDGVITVGEFFTLLQVHILIQKPRQSHLPANYAVNTAPTPEDLIFSQYVYRPKLQIYEEDCQVLSQMIEDLKLYAGVQDKLLVDVNKSLWEVMRTFSDKELKNFGTELNKMKSCFTKKSKVLAHKGKVKLYDNLVQTTQRLYQGALSSQEHLILLLYFYRDLSNLEVQKKQGFSEINHLQNKASDCEELLDKYNFTEWEISEWSDQQAVFTFLYDSIELIITFGPPVGGAVFKDNPCRKIVDMSFESLLDEEKAPLSSCLVQRLIFQFIESQGSWQTKCTTMHHLPQMLHEVSLVVNRCRLLGEEIEFLNRWGGKFNLLKTEVDNTKVKLLFSTSTVFAKFEVTFSLSANYPSAPLPFTVQKLIGSLGHDEISAVLSNVPLGTSYLMRMVKMIHHDLLQGSLIVH